MKRNGNIDLGIDFCGVHFNNPLILASAPPTATGAMIGRAFKAGWAGAVTKTLVLNAASIVNVTPRFTSLSISEPTEEPKKLYAFENIELATDREFTTWLKEIGDLRKKYPEHVVIASIMDDANKPDGWQQMAKQCEEAGAQIIELNLSCPHGMPEWGMGAAIGQDPELAGKVTRWTADAVNIPVMAKMTPNVADIGSIAKICMDAGAKVISAINSVGAIMGVELETLVPMPGVAGYSTHGGLSGLAIKPIALKAVTEIALATGNAPISGIGGIGTWKDAAEFMLLGASTLQVCTAVMTKGLSIIDDILKGLSDFAEKKGFSKLTDMVGVSLEKLVPWEELDTKSKVIADIDMAKCIQCDRCFIACQDAAWQAITKSKVKVYKVNEKRCIGCSLCYQVCPVSDCITMIPKAA